MSSFLIVHHNVAGGQDNVQLQLLDGLKGVIADQGQVVLANLNSQYEKEERQVGGNGFPVNDNVRLSWVRLGYV
jgi:hypothetical protein